MNYLYNIAKEECVGDALGKFNYNFLTTDNNICQLSSLYFLDNPNLYTEFLELSSKFDILNIVGDAYNSIAIYNQVYTAVSLLSSYWLSQEITIQYPINFIQDVNQSIKIYYLDNSSTNDNLLKNAAKNYLDTNFPANAHYKNFTINVSFVLYSSNGNFTQSVINPNKPYPISQYWEATFIKDDVHITRSRNVKFKNISNTWVYKSIE